jgi:hypothetical protein
MVAMLLLPLLLLGAAAATRSGSPGSFQEGLIKEPFGGQTAAAGRR